MAMSKVKIGAAILEKSFDQLEKRLREARGIVDFMQIDICDGKFVPSKTVGSAGCAESFKRIAKLTKNDILELDMMVDLDTTITGRFEKWMHAITLAKPSRTILHYGSTKRWNEVFKYLKGKGIKLGLGVHLHHKNSDILKMLDKYPFSYVQVMGIEKVGFGGQKFSNKTYAKVRAIRKAKPKMDIAIDGAVKVENAKKLVKAGATRLSSGSGLFKYKDGIKEAAHLMRE